ncbi:MAG: MFS transporter, partial [Deinococcus sp.]
LVTAYLLGTLGGLLGFLGAWQRLIPLFLLGAALVGAAQGGYQQARYAVSEELPERVRGAALGLMMLASVAGSTGTTALSGALMGLATRLDTSSEVIGWLLAAGFLLLGALLTALWRPGRPAGAAGPARAGGKGPRLLDPEVRWPALAVAVSQGLMVTLMSLTPLRAHHMGMDHLHIAGLITVHISGMFGFGWLTGPLLDRLGSRPGYAAGALLLCAAALTALLSGAWLGPSMFLLGLGWNFSFVAGSKALTRFPQAQGQVDALGYGLAAAGTLLGGLLISHAGFASLALLCALLGLLPLLSAWQPGRRSPLRAVATD